MGTPHRVSGLDIEQDLPFQERLWKVERVGWLIIGLLLVAALLGLMGSGPLSSTKAEDPTGTLQVEYDRFGRSGRPMVLRIAVKSQPDAQGLIHVYIDERYLHGMAVETITPRPVREELSDGQIRYAFGVSASRAPAAIDIRLKPDEAGRIKGWVGLPHGPSLEIGHFIYP